MSNECWKEFKGWCKAFLLTEILLALLEAFLFILCVAFMVFLIMHMMVCQTWTSDVSHNNTIHNTTTEAPYTTVTVSSDNSTGKDEHRTTESDRGKKSTVDPKKKCSWTPSAKTAAASRYYEQTSTAVTAVTTLRRADGDSPGRNASARLTLKYSPTMNMTYSVAQLEQQLEGVDLLALDDESDGEAGGGAGTGGGALLALVRPARGRGGGGARGAFGCALAAVSPRWLLTAASCIAAIEEVDSLDEYVITEGAGGGRRYGVGDVQLHPLWQGANRSYDCAALRAEPPLRPPLAPLALPALPDYFLLTLGERLTILGFGPFRSTEPTSAEREVRAVSVYSLPPALCREPPEEGPGPAEGEGAEVDAEGDGEADGAGWAPRHLSRGREEPHSNGGCGAAMVCAGVRWARGGAGGACGYCAGTPLVRGGALLGLMAGRACARDCAPAGYVNLALLRDWIDMVLAD